MFFFFFVIILGFLIRTDRTQNRYNRFGSFLAEDGWPDSQVDLAKQLLNENCGKLSFKPIIDHKRHICCLYKLN